MSKRVFQECGVLTRRALLLAMVLSLSLFGAAARVRAETPAHEPFVALVRMQMAILPGTSALLNRALSEARTQGAQLVVLELDTPGGMLNTSQEMIQAIFASELPVVVYVSPSGGTAASAGVFITMAAHIAAMAPGTSIGAAHPVAGDGKDIEGDMRKKAENLATAMVRSIAEQRGRNTDWAERAVKESSSLTEREALERKVIDIVAPTLDELLRKISGHQVKLSSGLVTLKDLSSLPRRTYQLDYREQAINVLANPNVVALLWLAATTGLSIELYNPGLILPGVVGVIALILALAVSQVIPVNIGAVALLLVGALLIGAELIVPSGILGLGGVLAIVLGSVYLIDVSQAPTLAVTLELIVPVALLLGGFLLLMVSVVVRSSRRKVSTGSEGLLGAVGTASTTISLTGKVFLNGELWNARTGSGVIAKGSEVEVVAVSGLVLEVQARR